MSACRFWIVTPCFNSLQWLPCAVASVADQAGEEVIVHHHVQDGGSNDGTRQWLEQYAEACARDPRPGYTFSFESAPDQGMYDAINKGWAKAPEAFAFLAHLNSDEQYLPGALAAVAQTLERDPQASLILGDAIVADSEGKYICHQSSVMPWRWMSRFFCLVLTCTAFYRRDLLQTSGVRFDTSWRILGDMLFYRQLFERQFHTGLCNQVTTVFIDSGENLATSPASAKELTRYRETYRSRLGRLHLSPWVQKINTLRRVWKDLFHQKPGEYQIFRPGDKLRRKLFKIAQAKSLWRRSAS